MGHCWPIIELEFAHVCRADWTLLQGGSVLTWCVTEVSSGCQLGTFGGHLDPTGLFPVSDTQPEQSVMTWLLQRTP